MGSTVLDPSIETLPERLEVPVVAPSPELVLPAVVELPGCSQPVAKAIKNENSRAV